MCWTHLLHFPHTHSRDKLKHNFQQDSSQLKKSIVGAFSEPECKNCTYPTTELQTPLRQSDNHLHWNIAWCSNELNLQ